MEGATRASAREGARWRGERERERERAADSEGAESRLRKMTAPRLLSVCPVGRPVLAGRESVRQEARRKRARGRSRARERGAGGVWRGSDRRVRLRDSLLSKKENLNAYLHPSESLLPFSSYNEQDRRRVRAGADTLRHSTTGAAGGRRRAHTHTHTHCRTHTTQHHTRGNLVLLIFIPTHPPWSWAQPESRFSRTERRLDLPVQHHKLYIQHIHQPDPKRSGRVPSWHRACTNASHSSV